MKGELKMNAVIYARHKEKQEIENQIKACDKYAEENGYTVISKYIDVDSREQFEKMIEDSEQKNFQAVIVYKLDRFARDRYESATNKMKLKKNGARVYSAKDNIADDASGVLMESIFEGMAEYHAIEQEEKKKKIIQLIEEL